MALLSENKKDLSISLARLVATVFIIVCHFMQYYGLLLAWWFNVGVQIFLCMSGFLYGGRDIKNPIAFYKKQIPKILIDYYIVILTVSVLQLIIMPEEITLSVFIKSILTYGTLSGGAHMWYIPYILLCYLITPLISRLVRLFDKSGRGALFVLYSVLLLGAVTVIFGLLNFFNPAWICCYIIGFILGYTRDKAKKVFSGLYIAIAVACLIMNVIRIYVDYVAKLSPEGTVGLLYTLFQSLAHVALGSFIFLSIHLGFTRAFAGKSPALIKKLLCVSDKISYDVYLVHQFMILGPMSLMTLTAHAWLNVVIISVLIIALAFLVNYLALCVKKLFSKKQGAQP